MKLTEDVRQITLRWVREYAERLSIDKPHTLMTTREVLDMPRQVTVGRRTSAYKYYGVAYIKHKIVFINIRKIPDIAKLEEIIAHELAHLRFPYLSHGRRFDGVVRRAMGGEVFAPYRPKTPRHVRRVRRRHR